MRLAGTRDRYLHLTDEKTEVQKQECFAEVKQCIRDKQTSVDSRILHPEPTAISGPVTQRLGLSPSPWCLYSHV